MTDLQPVRFSHLKRIAQSPAHYRAALADDKDSPAMRMGRVIDAYVFAADPMPVVYDGERRGNKWKEFETENEGREIITVTEHDRARACADAILRHPRAAEVLQGDRWCEWQWKYLGRDCISHPDLVAPTHIADLKTSQSAEPRWFIRHAAKMGYHAQLAFYRLAARCLGASTAETLYIVVAEPVPPYAVTVIELDEDIAEIGERLCREWMERLLVCEANNHWPAYVETQEVWSLDGGDFDLIYPDPQEAA